MGFKQIAPGVLVSDQFKVEMQHPDPCWVLESKDGLGVAMSQTTGCLFGFSTEKHLRTYAEALEVPMDKYHPVAYAWADLVNKCRKIPGITIDHTGKPGFFKTIPLQM